MESEQLQNLRAKIAEIKKQGYDIQTETKLIQELTYKPKPKKSFEDSLNSSEILEFSEEFLQLTYYNKEEGNLGCVHYHRNAKILTECCKNLYSCRLCHDEAEGHKIDRFATKYMMCMSCDKKSLQEIGQECKFCSTKMAEYYCDVCK